MLLANVLITSAGDDEPIPPTVQENIASLKDQHPGHEHRLFRQDDVVQLIEEKFSKEVLHAFRALRPFAYRADLARYCILYQLGGLYADLSYFFLAPVPMPPKRAVVFRGNLVSSPWDTSNGVIYAPARHKALERAIELVCANVKRRYYGLTPLCPTGPALLGKAVAMTCEAEELITGLAQLMDRQVMAERLPDLALPDGDLIHCQFLKQELIAVKRKPIQSQGLKSIGITSGNAYRGFWNRREVYA